MTSGVLVEMKSIFTAKNNEKKIPKSIEISPQIDFWALLGTLVGATLEPLGKYLGHMLPKDWILQALGRVLGAQDDQFGSNLEAQDPPKSMQKGEKVDIKKQHVFGIVFSGAWA